MSDEWGRAAEAGKWQRALPIWFMSVILLALACGIGTFWVRQAFVWTPLQQFYVSAYARSALAMKQACRNPLVHFHIIRGENHFSEIAVVTPVIARKILADTGPRANLSFP